MPGWERLLQTRDAAERLVLRTVLFRAVEDADQIRNSIPEEVGKRLEVLIQRGVAQAFKN